MVGSPFPPPDLPTWSGRTVRSWDQAEPETADLSDFVALARDSGATAWRRGGPPFHPRTRGAGRTARSRRFTPARAGQAFSGCRGPPVTRGLRSGVFVTSLLVFSERYGDLERQPVSSLRA